jgi:hypothetical protein
LRLASAALTEKTLDRNDRVLSLISATGNLARPSGLSLATFRQSGFGLPVPGTPSAPHYSASSEEAATHFMYGSARHAREIESLHKDAQRLTELKQFLAESASPSNRRRTVEVDEELKRIERRLAELERAS